MLNFDEFLSLEIQLNFKKLVLEGENLFELQVHTWANGTCHTNVKILSLSPSPSHPKTQKKHKKREKKRISLIPESFPILSLQEEYSGISKLINYSKNTRWSMKLPLYQGFAQK
jgi:hypothetical protein